MQCRFTFYLFLNLPRGSGYVLSGDLVSWISYSGNLLRTFQNEDQTVGVIHFQISIIVFQGVDGIFVCRAKKK